MIRKSPLLFKVKEPAALDGKKATLSTAGRQLFQTGQGDQRKLVKKMKLKRAGANSSLTPDLNLPAKKMPTEVPKGLVSSRVSQFVGSPDCNADVAAELSKKQKTSATQHDARSAAAADGSPGRAQ